MNTSMNSTEDHDGDEDDFLAEILELSFPTAITALGVILNVLSICGMLGFKALRKWTNIFTFNLSLSDFVASLGILLGYGSFLHPESEGFNWTEPIFTTGLIVSILSTLAIAVQRLIIVRVDPLGERHIITPCRSVSVCAIGWLTVATLHLVAFFLEGIEDPVVTRITTTVVIWVALLITLTCYGAIYCRIASAKKYLGKQDGVSEHGIDVSKRILITFALVAASTFVCWVPISLILLMEGLGVFEDAGWVIILDGIAFNLLCLNQVINPLIYWSRLSSFRDQLRMCCCCCGRKRLSEQPEKDMTISNTAL